MAALRPRDPFRCTTLLASKSNVGRKRRRRFIIGSVVFHVVLLVVVIIASPKHREPEDVFAKIDIVFRSPIQEEPLPPPPPPPAALKPVHVPKPKPQQLKVSFQEPEAPVVAPPRPAVAPPAPVPNVPKPIPRVVQPAAGFEVAAVQAPRPRELPRVVTSGGFGGAVASVSRTKALPPPTPGAGGAFPSAAAPGPPGPHRSLGLVVTTGFDTAGSSVAKHEASAGVVRQGGFATGIGAAAPAPGSRALQQPSSSRDTPIEILSKPKPTYTEEARQLRLEGEVVLEVTFVASGVLRVLRVLEGLGHGLDEAAVDAVQKIHFTPAKRDGRPVDQTTTLRVVFRLA